MPKLKNRINEQLERIARLEARLDSKELRSKAKIKSEELTSGAPSNATHVKMKFGMIRRKGSYNPRDMYQLGSITPRGNHGPDQLSRMAAAFRQQLRQLKANYATNNLKPSCKNRPNSTTMNDMYQLGSINARLNIITDQLLQWIVYPSRNACRI